MCSDLQLQLRKKKEAESDYLKIMGKRDEEIQELRGRNKCLEEEKATLATNMRELKHSDKLQKDELLVKTAEIKRF
jgi:hypothetical protein